MARDQRKPALIFDVGNVLVFLENSRMLSNVSALLHQPPGPDLLLHEIRSSPIGTGLPVKELWRAMRDRYGSDSGYEHFLEAWSSHFSPNQELINLLPQLAQTWRLAICSNTNDGHWVHIEREYQLSRYFDHVVLSHECGFQKPGHEIYALALERLDVAEDDARPIFFDDDARNVSGAARAGLDARLFSSTADLIEQLRPGALTRS